MLILFKYPISYGNFERPMKKLFLNKLAVKKSTIHGYGVYAEKKMRKGEMLEECYFILSDCEHDVVIDYIFEANSRSAILFGYGSLYNHSQDPNAEYKLNLKTKIATFKASRTIQKGEEIFVSYGDEWFDSRDMKEK